MNYDITSPISIEGHAKKLIDKTFRDILPNDNAATYRGKGNLGQLVEKYHFGYEPNSNKEPDFKEAGVELKVAGFKKLNRGPIPYSAKERLVLNIINFEEIVNETFESSSFLYKNKLLLLIFYLYDLGVIDNLDFVVKYAQLFSYPEEDLRIIEQDWNKIVEKIRDGQAHELSEGDTLYLGACTKGNRSEDSYRNQPFSGIKAPQRALSLKTSYMTHVFRNYILNERVTYEPIIRDSSILETTTFEDYVVNQITPHFGKSIGELCREFNVNIKSKDCTSRVALKILGVNTVNAEEFEKANIKIKAIRIGANRKIKEHMSFPTFKFTEIIQEEWDSSEFRTMLEETKFFWVLYCFDESGNLYLENCMFWNMPNSTLDTEVKSVWERTVSTIKNGVELVPRGKKIYNNLPSPSQNPVAHVRPHAQDSSDTYPLPDGRTMAKQCFWLNNSFILEQIKNHFGENL